MEAELTIPERFPTAPPRKYFSSASFTPRPALWILSSTLSVPPSIASLASPRDLPPATMAQDNQAKQKPEVDGGHDEQVDGGNAVGMIAQEGHPASPNA